MTTPFITSEDVRLHRPVTIDGIDIDIGIGSLSIEPAPITESVDTIDGGSVTFQPSMPGGANLVDRYTISFPVEAVRGDVRHQLERIRARGGYHTFAYWKPISAFYTVTNAALDLLLPRYRQNAPQLFAGLIYSGVTMGTAVAPFKAWVNGVAQTVRYSGGAPGAGEVLVGSGPNVSGQTKDYVPFTVGGLVFGDVVEIEFFPAFLMVMTAPRIAYPQTVAETFNYQFRER